MRLCGKKKNATTLHFHWSITKGWLLGCFSSSYKKIAVLRILDRQRYEDSSKSLPNPSWPGRRKVENLYRFPGKNKTKQKFRLNKGQEYSKFNLNKTLWFVTFKGLMMHWHISKIQKNLLPAKVKKISQWGRQHYALIQAKLYQTTPVMHGGS